MPKINITEERVPPEGEYTATVANVSEGQTKAGDDMWTITLQIEEGEYKGQLVEDRIVFSVAAMKRLRIVAKAFKLPLPLDGIEPSDILGKRVQIVTTEDEYNGELKAKVLFNGYKPAAPAKDSPRARVAAALGAEVVREPGDDRAPLPEYDEPPEGAEDLPF